MTLAVVVRVCPECRRVLDEKDRPAVLGALSVTVSPPRGIYQGQRFHLARQWAQVLHHLVRAGEVSCQALIQDAFPESLTAEKQLQVVICHLRKALRAATGDNVVIRNIPSWGYEMEVRP